LADITLPTPLLCPVKQNNEMVHLALYWPWL